MIKKNNKIIRDKGLQSSFDEAGITADKTALRETHTNLLTMV